MDVTIRELREADIEAVNAFHNAQLGMSRTVEQFRWEFLDGPYGPSTYVVAEYDGEIVGTHATLPVWLTRRGTRFLASKDEETALAPQFRGRGIGARLFAAASERAAVKGVKITFGIPNAPSLRSHVRTGHSYLGKATYGALVWDAAQTSDLLYAHWKNQVFSRLTLALGPSVFRALCFGAKTASQTRRFARTDSVAGLMVEAVQHVDRRLDTFASEFGQAYAAFTPLRSSEYLQWRLLDNPYSQAWLVLALREGRVLAYAALSLSRTRPYAELTDVCALPQYDGAASLAVQKAIDIARECGAACIVAWSSMASSPQTRTILNRLRSLGFVFPSLGSHLIAYETAEGDRTTSGFDEPRNWYVTLLLSQGVM